MKPDADALITGVQTFLNQILDELPAGRRSDVRAAVKSLENVRAELDDLFPVLMTECEELAAACAEAEQALGRAGSGGAALPPCSSLGALKVRHGELLAQVGDLAVQLLGRSDPQARDALASICRTLGAQGRRRLGWQSVFPQDALVSDVLKSTWPEDRST